MKNIEPEELEKLLDEFDKEILPWCQKYNLSLMESLIISKKKDTKKYNIINALNHTKAGNNYLKSILPYHKNINIRKCDTR